MKLPASKKQAAGYVYLLYDGAAGLSKIGCTTRDGGKRQRELTGSHGAVLVNVLNVKVSDCYAVEAQCHAFFSSCRRNGEWFAVPYSDVLLYVSEKVQWLELDIMNQARMGAYLRAAEQLDYKRMRKAVYGPNSAYFDEKEKQSPQQLELEKILAQRQDTCHFLYSDLM